MMPPDTPLWLLAVYLVLGVVLGFVVGHMVARKKAEKMINDILSQYTIRGQLSYATPSLVTYAVKRVGAWMPQGVGESRGGE